MAKAFLDPDRLARVHEQAAHRLARLADTVPPARQQAQQPPFAEYLRAAQQRAATDPAFSADLARALAQYRVIGGV